MEGTASHKCPGAGRSLPSVGNRGDGVAGKWQVMGKWQEMRSGGEAKIPEDGECGRGLPS